MYLYFAVYICSLLLVALIYYSVSVSYRKYVLLAASFGAITLVSWQVAVYAVLFSGFNFLMALRIQNSKGHDKRRLWYFWTAIGVDIAFLSFFKYAGVLAGIADMFTVNESHFLKSIVIPLGISYYTFQALGYIIRVNRGSDQPESDFFTFLLFLTFFPKFFSGPVERSNKLLPQLHKSYNFKSDDLQSGIKQLIWGAFKKFVIAYQLYTPVHQLYADPTSYTGVHFMLIFVVQTFYIYMEFSGYTDMALGSSKVLGINLTDNFNRPLLARNVSEFWRRWHISLSSWCNDFIYNPFIVKYRRFDNLAVIGGVFLTFFTIGIWHELNLTFIILGLLQAVAIVYEFYTKKWRLRTGAKFSKAANNAVSRILVFLFVSLSMVFFFSPDFGTASYMLSHLFQSNGKSFEALFNQQNMLMFLGAIFIFLILFVSEMYAEKGKKFSTFYQKLPVWTQWSGYALLTIAVFMSAKHWQAIEYMRF
jgi:D-alanyl-lipoteichoic acid acyltransferase DltB (MBOAT superfamily)